MWTTSTSESYWPELIDSNNTHYYWSRDPKPAALQQTYGTAAEKAETGKTVQIKTPTSVFLMFFNRERTPVEFSFAQ